MRAISSPQVNYSFGPELGPSSHDRMAKDLLLGLQFCRANTMSLTRLQIALKTNDRQCALDVMDQLHELDARIEQLVRRLPQSADNEPEWEAINKHLGQQKMAIAFEKLVFASGVRGPDLVSRPTAIPAGEDDKITSLAWPKLRDIEPHEASEFPWEKAGALFLAILIFVILIGFIGFVTSP